MLNLIRTARDFREFLAAKKRKREPVRLRGHGAASASYEPRDAHGFAAFRRALRGVGDWGRASERLDALEHALVARHQCTLPLPRKIIQNEDRSLTFFWPGISVRCFEDRTVAFLGGPSGVPTKGHSRELLDMLAFQAKIQQAS